MTDYTNTLKLAKPAAGESAWGNTVNTGLTDMVEEAISGLKVINTWTSATPAIHVLTSADGATSESRAAILKLTDTGGVIPSVGQVTVPANSKLYCVINETGHTVTVKTASGTGIAVPTATVVNLVCDGTNVVEQDNFSVALNAGTVTTTGLTNPASLKVSGSGSTVTEIADEDTMSSNSATKLATQQSIKSYVDSVGSFTMSQIIPAIGAGGDATGFTPVTITSSISTLTSFTVPSSATTDYIILDIATEYNILAGGTSTDNNIQFYVEKKSKKADGVSLGTVASSTRFGTGTSQIWQVAITGDVIHLLDSFSTISMGQTAGSTNYNILGFQYVPQNNTTAIWLDSNSTLTSNITVGQTAYVGNDGYVAVNSWVSGITVIEADAAYGTASSAQETFTFPKIVCKNTADSNTEFRIRAQTGGLNTAQLTQFHVHSQDVKGKE